MKRSRFGRCLLLLIVLLAPNQLVSGKGPPDKMTISGPGVAGMIEVLDREVLNALDLSVFWQIDSRPSVQATVDEGYELVYYYKNGGRTFMRAFSLMYYPN